MKVFIGSLVIFFGTLLAAGVIALGQPGVPGSPSPGAFGADDGASAPPPTAAPVPNEPGWERLFAIRGLR